MVRKWYAAAVSALLVVGLLAGCGGGGETPAEEPDFKAAMVTDVGGLNDDSFNASAWRGLNKAKTDLNVGIKAMESKRNEDYDPNMRSLLDQNYDLIWGIGYMMTDIVGQMADENPDSMFAIVDSVVDRPNVASVVFREEEGSFLMGVMAAKTTKTGKVGFVGGGDSEVIHHFEAGYRAGVKAVDPNVEVIVVYSGVFDNPTKGKNDALAIYNQGADIIFHAAGATGKGVIQAAEEKDKLAIGVDSDQNKLAPNHVLSSMMKRVDNAVFEVTKLATEDKFPGGETVVMGLKDKGVGYSDTTLWDKMPEGTKELVDKWAQAIVDGKASIPNDPEELKDWTVPEI